MKAAVFKEIGAPLVIEDVPDPEPGLGDLILKVRACGICGTDIHWAQNHQRDAGWRLLETGAVMGHEFAGEIVEIGKDARAEWKIGDRVTAQPFSGCGTCPACLGGRAYRCKSVTQRASLGMPGAYAEYTRVGTSATMHLPEAVSFSEGALVEPLAVGLNAVRRAGLRAGDRVLIIGAGPVGLAVALWCRFFGAHHIVASDLVSARAEAATRFGATAAIDAGQDDVKCRFEAIAGGPPNILFDCVGVPGSLQLTIDQAPPDAHIVVVGLCMAQDTFFPAKAIMKELNLTFAFIYQKRDFTTVIDMLASGRIKAAGLITDHVGIDAFPAAFEALKTPSDQIKVMLEPG